MSIDFNQPHPPPGPVIAVTGVSVPVQPPYDTGIAGLTMTLERGALAMILLEHGSWSHPLADVLSGLLEVEQGDVRIFGQAWAERNADRQAMARWRIGRIFEGNGWMSNLDVDENVTLAERHHSRRPPGDIEAEAARLAQWTGLEALPITRPSVTGREELRRAEWVRAALGSPWLLIAERPGRDLSEGWLDDFIPLVRAVREAGTAVVWLAGDAEEWNCDSLNPVLKWRAQEDKLLPVNPT